MDCILWVASKQTYLRCLCTSPLLQRCLLPTVPEHLAHCIDNLLAVINGIISKEHRETCTRSSVHWTNLEKVNVLFAKMKRTGKAVKHATAYTCDSSLLY